MKITEITEGWGEYSNKSNHQMNKFKRQDTDEGWGEFKSAAGRGAQAVGGAMGRSAMRGARRVAAKMGSGQAQGALQMDKALMGVMKNYQRYLGQSSLKQDAESLKNYLTALGIENPIMEVAKGARRGQARSGFDRSKRGAQQPKAQAQQAPAQQAPSAKGELSRNQVAEIIRKNIEAGLKAGTLPKELKQFLSK